MHEKRPKFLVFLAAFNGRDFLEDQINSILEQEYVDVKIVISVDRSTDGTEQLVDYLASTDTRIEVLTHGLYFGSAGANFYRLIEDVDFTSFDYIAFSDQDDIWLPNKLIRGHEMITKTGASGYSSNVIAFWLDGTEKLIVKSQLQREFDYLFESAGPGCTFIMTPWLVNEIKCLLKNPFSISRNVTLHDWLAYSICRASGHEWFIDSMPTMRYRQHSSNVIGANRGIKAKFERIKKVFNGWYRREVIKVAQVCSEISGNPSLKSINECLTKPGIKSRFGLLRYATEARRGFSDRMFLAFSILIGLF